MSDKKKKTKKIKPKSNTIFQGDNLAIMQAMPDECVDLIYIDPPFFTQKDYKNIWGDMESVQDYKDIRQVGYSDKKDFFERHIKSGQTGLDAYLEWMRYRVKECHRILKSTGSFYLHLDHHAVHYMKVICDEIFKYSNFRNEIIWQRKIGSNSAGKARSWSNNSDYILFYSKTSNYDFKQLYKKDLDNLPESISKAYSRNDNDGKGFYQLGPLSAPSYSPSLIYDFKGYRTPKNGWRWTKARMEKAYRNGILHLPKDKNKMIRQKMFLSNWAGVPVESIWTDIRCLQGQSKEFTGWPTQKPVALLERIISASSNPGDLIFDCFAGCGTSMHAAHILGRKWIGVDISPTAIKVNKKRLEELGSEVTVVTEKDLKKSHNIDATIDFDKAA